MQHITAKFFKIGIITGAHTLTLPLFKQNKTARNLFGRFCKKFFVKQRRIIQFCSALATPLIQSDSKMLRVHTNKSMKMD